MQPSAKTLKIIQDKYVQKEHMSKQEGVALGPYKKVTCAEDVEDLGVDWGWPVMLKSRLMVGLLVLSGRSLAFGADLPDEVPAQCGRDQAAMWRCILALRVSRASNEEGTAPQ